jgi:hypothetical protein
MLGQQRGAEVKQTQEDLSRADLDALVAAILNTDDVDTPKGYDDIDAAAIDAIFSLRVRYGAVTNILKRYNAFEDVKPRSLSALAELIDASGGPDGFADRINNRGLTSSRNGILKADALRQAIDALPSLGIDSQADLHAAIGTNTLGQAKGRWTSVRGQGSGLSWRYFLMLNRIEDVKADRMVTRFCTEALGRPIDPNLAAALVTEAAAELNQTPRHVDHRIWHHQRNTPKRNQT